MPVVKIALDTETFHHLTNLAKEQRRSVAQQGEVLLLQSLNRWPAPDYPVEATQEHAA